MILGIPILIHIRVDVVSTSVLPQSWRKGGCLVVIVLNSHLNIDHGW